MAADKNAFKLNLKRKNPEWMKKLLASIEDLSGDEVAMGYPRGGEAEAVTYPNGLGVLQNAVIQNFGGTIDHPGGTPYKIVNGKAVFVPKDSPEAAALPKTKPHKIDIPARPFMDEAVKIIEKDAAGEGAALAKQVVQGKLTAEQALKQIGALGEKAIRLAIIDGDYKPNAPSTLRRKESTKPLVDTGKLTQSVSSVVRKKGES